MHFGYQVAPDDGCDIDPSFRCSLCAGTIALEGQWSGSTLEGLGLPISILESGISIVSSRILLSRLSICISN